MREGGRGPRAVPLDRSKRRSRCPRKPRGGAAFRGSAHAFIAFVSTNALGYGLLSSTPVASPVLVRVANGVYEFGLKTYASSVPWSP